MIVVIIHLCIISSSDLNLYACVWTVVVIIMWYLDLQLPMQSVPITTTVVSSNLAQGKVYSIQQYVIKFVSDLRQVACFLWALRFPPPIKLTTTIYWNIVESGAKHHNPIIVWHKCNVIDWMNVLHYITLWHFSDYTCWLISLL